MSDADNIAGLGRALELAAIQVTEYRETIDRLSTDLAAARAELAAMRSEAAQTVLDSMRSVLVRQRDAIATARQEAAAQGRAAGLAERDELRTVLQQSAKVLMDARCTFEAVIQEVRGGGWSVDSGDGPGSLWARVREMFIACTEQYNAASLAVSVALSSPPEPAAPAQPDAAARRAVAAYERFAAQEGDQTRCLTAESRLAEVEAERDALKAGKWAGAWGRREPPDHYQVGWYAWVRGGSGKHWAEHATVCPNADVTWWSWNAFGGLKGGPFSTADEAKAAADAALVAAGWWLEPSPSPTKAAQPDAKEEP